MIQQLNIIKFLFVASLVGFLGACAMTYEERDVSYKETPLNRPVSSVKESELLSVRIKTFDPGEIPSDPDLAKGMSLDIRKAETYYIASNLKDTMQRSGHWGPVRIVPKGARENEVVVNGKILQSDGEILELEINVKDASGATWFTKEYESVINEDVYADAEQKGIEPYQDLYNEIANDIAQFKVKLKAKVISTIRQISELRFGADFAPSVFNNYIQTTSTKNQNANEGANSEEEEDSSDKSPIQNLFAFLQGEDEKKEKPEETEKEEDKEENKEESGNPFKNFVSLLQGDGEQNISKPTYKILSLPSPDDPTVMRVNKIRSREEYLIDNLDQQYDGLTRNIRDAYTQWRYSRLKEVNAIRKVETARNEKEAQAVAVGILAALAGAAMASGNRNGNCYSCTTTGVAIAGAGVAVAVQMASQAAQQAEADTEMRKTALEELGRSLETDVKPIVIDIEGKTVKLTGTVEEKFQKWRKVLTQLRENETGLMTTIPKPKNS